LKKGKDATLFVCQKATRLIWEQIS
jgi:hypothetical protein